MKILVTSGHPHSGYEIVQKIMQAAGLGAAQPSRREGMTVEELHANIFKAHEIEATAPEIKSGLEPGKIWQELGVDLFLGNLSQDVWGWADARSTWLLDFWKTFDKQTRFILVYSSPEAAVGSMLENREAPPDNIDAEIASWVSLNAEILRFYHRNRERCTLVNATAVMQAPASLIEQVRADFGLHALPADFAPEQNQFSAVTGCLAKALVEDYSEAAALYQELESAADLSLSQAATPAATAQQAWQDYINLRKQLANLAQAQQHQTGQLDGLQAEYAALKKAKQGHKLTSAELAKENELLLLQLHQVQEELESNFKKQEERTKERDEQAKLATDRQKQVEQITQARDTQAKQAKDLSQENELLLLQLHQAQEELEHYFLKQEELRKKSDEQAKLANEYQKQIGQLTKARDEQSRLATNWQKQLEQMTQAREQQSLVTAERTKQIEKVCQARDRQAQLAAERQLQILELTEALAARPQVAPQQEEIDQLIAYARFWRSHQPAQVVIDLRREIDGDNWYHAEDDGRWAGPDNTSAIRMPSLRDGKYLLQLDVVDAMAPDITEGTAVFLNGIPLEVSVSGEGHPVVLNASFSTDMFPESLIWQFALQYPRLISPAASGSPDERNLAIRLGTLKLECIE
ncbi:hypothetical protein [Janthinobacterium sp. 17J80-10]|uniref:hypothetical protein n=1 Tax=Janthinobacterium sp. 17J80-10 TaxID=2497863 RepID=UPI00100530DF|nr:hypothetical protein [Janthinobacterium sp. 17J80-10]QAU35534.1 hypothetical protein EKL02_15940 [Janthinobacterium sp. 17J80-10]